MPQKSHDATHKEAGQTPRAESQKIWFAQDAPPPLQAWFHA
jgi:hypothetical protein